MSRIFRDVLVTVDNEFDDANELIDCMEELKAIYAERGDNHEHSVIAQVYGRNGTDTQFYLTGKILTPSQGRRVKAILAE